MNKDIVQLSGESRSYHPLIQRMIDDQKRYDLPTFQTLPMTEVLKELAETSIRRQDWKAVSGYGLRVHITNSHLAPSGLAVVGVARFDIELAKHTCIKLDSVVEIAYDKLERPDREIAKELRLYLLDTISPDEYKDMLVRNLIFMKKLRVAAVDMRKVERLYKGARNIELDINRDTIDPSFFDYLKRFKPSE